MRRRHHFTLLLLCFSLLLSLLPSVGLAASPGSEADEESGGHIPPQQTMQAAGVLPTSLFDPDSTSWYSGRNYSSSGFATWFDEMKDEYMLIDIEVDEFDGEQKVGGVWQKNTTNRGWAEHRNLSSSAFHDLWQDYADRGYRLIDQEAYTLGGTRYYAGIWVRNNEGYGWASYRNLTSQSFSEKFAEFSEKGYIMVDVEGYSTSNGLRYAMVWVDNAENLGWYEYRNMSSAEFAEKFDELKGKFRVWDIESYRHNGVQYYAGIWVENTNGRGWAEYRDMDSTGWRNRWYRMRDLGYRLTDYETYHNGSGQRYAGVWRQNNDRPDWSLKDDVNDLAEAYLADNDLPGLGVAIARMGEIKYSRGFGYQDVDDNVWYSARTINRLASVAKAVGGVLALDLLEDGDIADLDDPSSDYIPGLPAHHTHTLRQLLANRSGVGHYEDYSVTIQEYGTALAAIQNFWNTDSDPGTAGTQLVYTPGMGCKYSTHGLSFAGAIFEGATGLSIGNVVEQELSQPYGLSTLQVEDRDDGDANRATLYDEDNDEVAADDISWKVLGGGLEASAYDMVRFGMKVLDDTIIDQDSRDELFTVPAPTTCTDPDWGSHNSYALGWQVGTESGTQVVRKGGNQRGANTYIRMYPEKEIVIIILSNRNEGHSTSSLASAIGALMLAAEPAAEKKGMDMGGIKHRPLGKASLARTSDGLILSNIGASGDDGLEMDPNRAGMWQSELQVAFQNTDVRDLILKMNIGVGERKPGPELELVSTGAGLQLGARSGYQVSLFAPGTPPQHLQSSGFVIPFSPEWCATARAGSGLPENLCSFGLSFHYNPQQQGEWNLIFKRPLQMKTDNGMMSVKRIRLIDASSVSAAGANGTTTIDTVDLRASEMDSITVRNPARGEPGTQPQFDPAPQQDQMLYLPAVVK